MLAPLFVATLICSGPVSAPPPADGDATISGVVLDAATGEPRAGVHVLGLNAEDRFPRSYGEFRHPHEFLREKGFDGPSAVTDEGGKFSLPWPPPRDGRLPAMGPPGVMLVAADTWRYVPDPGGGFAAKADAEEAVELSLPRGGTIEGTVTVGGVPVPHARLRLIAEQTGPLIGMSGGFSLQNAVVADDRGRFRVPDMGPGGYYLRPYPRLELPDGTERDELVPQWVELTVGAGETTVADVSRPAGVSLSGTTTDADGTPLPGCVVVWSQYAEGTTGYADATVSDKDGRFAFEHVPPGATSLRARHLAAKRSTSYRPGEIDATGELSLDVGPGGADDVTTMLAPRVVSFHTMLVRKDGTHVLMGGERDSRIGALPPDFAGPLFDADEDEFDAVTASRFRLADHAGDVIAIDFWATWCGPCLAALPETKKVAEFAASRDDVTFVSVSLDRPEDAAALRDLMREREIDFPVVWDGEPGDWYENFAFVGVPTAFVIGRDGRFAAEGVHGAELFAAVKEAAAKPAPDGLADTLTTLKVAVPLDGESVGPGRRLQVVVADAGGAETYRAESAILPSAARVAVPLPVPPPGGSVTVSAEVEGLGTTTRTLTPAELAEEITLPLVSPRRIAGRVSTAAGTPAAGLTVTARGPTERTAVTDADGRFTLPAVPGDYSVTVAGDDRYAAIGRSERVSVLAANDPEPLTIEAATAVTVRGRVVDGAGAAVPDAKVAVRSADGEPGVVTDAEGRFALPGVASAGEVDLSVRGNRQLGGLSLLDATGTEPVRIVLGENLHQRLGGRLGTTAPPLPKETLAGDPLARPAGPTVAIFAELAHPLLEWDAVLAAAESEAARIGAGPPIVVSVDWGEGVARRAAGPLGLDPSAVRWVAADQYAALTRWGLRLPATVVAIDAAGVVRGRW